MGSPVDRNLLRTLADLCRLHLPAEREEQLAARLQTVVDAFEALASVPTAGVEPSPYPMPLPTHWRADEPVAPLPQATVVANASSTAAGAFLVPRVVEG